MDKKERVRIKPSLFTFEFLLVGMVALTAYMTWPYLLPLLLGLILAILANPFYSWLRRKKLGPKRSAFIVVVLILIVIVGPLSLLSSIAVKEGIHLGRSVLSNANFSFSSLASRLSSWRPVSSFIDDPQELEMKVKTFAEASGQRLSEGILIQASAVPDLLLKLALALLTCFFLLLDGLIFRDWLSDKIPLEREVQEALVHSFESTTVSVIRATIAASAAQTVVITIGFIVLGVPGLALAIGATFILSFIPVLGCSPVWAAAAIYLYLSGSLGKATCMVAFGLLAGVVDNIVRPMVLKGKADIHPLVSLVAVFGGIHLFGILGVFMGPIVAAVLILLLKTWPAVAKRAGLELPNEKAVSTVLPSE